MARNEKDGETLPVIVIGAGYAGLAVSYHLARHGVRHAVLERGRIGETWRTQRWNSFRLNTPNIQTVMPGDTYRGQEPEGVMTVDAFIDMLEGYARRHKLPVRSQTAVISASPDEGGAWLVETPSGTSRSQRLVVASGNLNRPVRPQWAADISARVRQIDASDYRQPDHLPAGGVLVVGGGQSGAQIAEDLRLGGRAVHLASSRVGRLPRRYRGKDIMIWLVASRFLDVSRQAVLQQAGRIPARGVLGPTQTISLQSLASQGITLLGRASGLRGPERLTIDADLHDNVRFADEASGNVKRYIDDYIRQSGLDAPNAEPAPAETADWDFARPAIDTLDLEKSGIGTIVWSAGFRGNFEWLKLPAALDAAGQPVLDDGRAQAPGLYFAGLDFGVTRKSGTILAIDEETRTIADTIAASL